MLDTPGGLSGLDAQDRERELSLKIPVIVYVSPKVRAPRRRASGSREAADVLAMAPETNIGSSTPINGDGSNIPSDLRRKVVNDAAASLRGLAKSHGRNATWADLAVRKASNLTAQEALQMNVIDLIAPSLPALLKTDRRAQDGARARSRCTRPARRSSTSQPGFFTRFLTTLIDPNIVGLLFLAGIAGLGFELFHPGRRHPGRVRRDLHGLRALRASRCCRSRWAGRSLVLLGFGLLVVDAHVASARRADALGAGRDRGRHAARSSTRLLRRTTSIPLVVDPDALLLGGFWAFAMAQGCRVRGSPVRVGPQDDRRQRRRRARGGYVFVRRRALAGPPDGEPLAPGEQFEVDALEGPDRLDRA